MEGPLISGGYILLSRKLIESEIFQKPPLYLKVWIYLLSSAQHSQYKNLNRGQLFTSIPDIQNACSYYVGYRKQVPSKDQIFNILKWLRRSYEGGNESNDEHVTNTTMITTTRATQGMLVNIEQYLFYQDPNNYKTNNEDDDEEVATTTTKKQREQRQSDNTNKNGNNKQKCNNENNKKPLEIEQETFFNTFWETYPKKLAKKDAIKAFAKIKMTEELLQEIISSVKAMKATKSWKEGYAPNPATYLNGERWKDEVPAERSNYGTDNRKFGSDDGANIFKDEDLPNQIIL